MDCHLHEHCLYKYQTYEASTLQFNPVELLVHCYLFSLSVYWFGNTHQTQERYFAQNPICVEELDRLR